MSSPVVTIRGDATAFEAIELMVEKGIGSLAVIVENKFIRMFRRLWKRGIGRVIRRFNKALLFPFYSRGWLVGDVVHYAGNLRHLIGYPR